MNPYQNLSYQQKNQFIPQQQKNNDPDFQNFFWKCFSDPKLVQSMKQVFTQNLNKQTINNNQINNQQSKSTSISNNSNNQKKLYQYDDQLNTNQNEKIKKIINNPLLKYQPKNQQKNINKISQEQIINNYDDKPIKSQYIQNFSNNNNFKQSIDLNSIKENQSINIDIPQRINKINKSQKDIIKNNIQSNKSQSNNHQFRDIEERPIKGMTQIQLQQFYKEDKNIKNYNSSFSSHNNYIDDDRPIQGAKKDFKELIKQQFPGEIAEDYQNQYTEEEKKVETRTFLKRGSRQHLSSAVNRSKNKRQDELNKSGLDKSRDLTPKNNQRSTSQNRVLAKKTVNQNQKPNNRGGVKNQVETTGLNTYQISKAKPPIQNNKKVKQQTTNNKLKFEPKASQQVSKKKKKNVFDDNSSQSSSSSSDEQPFFKAIQKSDIREQNQGKIQVIDSVYLTQDQLQQILKKYGKSSQPKQSQSQKIQAIRNKYTELCQLVQSQRKVLEADLQRERQQFQKQKAEQLAKLKNERRVMQRQLKSGSSNQNLQKERQQLQNLKQQIQRQRQQFKKKQKNNKIMLDKYKKQNQELRNKMERFQAQKEQLIHKKSNTNISDNYSFDDKATVGNIKNNKTNKIQQQVIKQEISYRDVKKGTKPTNRVKFEYTQQQVTKQKPITANINKQIKLQNKWNNSSSSSQNEQGDGYINQQQNISTQINSNMKLSDLCKINLSIKMINNQIINSLLKHENNNEYKKYKYITNLPTRTVINTTRNNKNGYIVNTYSDRSKQLIYDNGTRKQTFQNGYSIVYFKNGDIKQTLSDQTILYYFKQKQVDQITINNGINIYRFDNNQVELHFPNGSIQIRHPDGTIKVLGGDHIRR